MPEPLILHAPASNGEGVNLPLALTGLPNEIEGRKVHYRRKEIIADGEWVHRGERKRFSIDPNRTHLWEENYRKRLSAGIKTPILKRHTEAPTADDTLGYIVGIERKGDKVFADMQFIGDDALALAARNDVSIYEKAEGIDAKGNPFGLFLDHIALTPNPNQPHLGPFVTIAASASGAPALEVPVFEPDNNPGTEPERSPIMKPETILKLRAKLNLTDTKAVPDEEVAERAAVLALADPPADKTAEVTALSADVTRLTKERDDAKRSAESATLALSAAAPKEYDPLALTLITESFGTWRDKAVTSGAISENGMKALDALLLPGGKPSPIALSLSAGSTRPLYAQVCEIIAGNPGVKTGHGVTRATALQLSADDQNDPLAHMTPEERRAYAAQCMGVSPVAKSA
jgi:hypothetical protein